MVFYKSFPRYVDKKNPVWEEIKLSTKEEKEIERKAVLDNINLMEKCIENARSMAKRLKMDMYQSDIVRCAVALFEKRARHMVYYKDQKAKEKFEKNYKR